MGITLNLFIVVVQFMRWKTLKSLDTCDKILTCLGIFRSLFLANIFVAYLMRTYLTWIIQESIFFNLGILLSGLLLHCTDLWITTILCVFYCVKIANYSHVFLVYMKTKISRLVPRFILASLLISVASSIPIVQYGLVLHRHNSTNVFPEDVIANNAEVGYAFIAQVIIFLLGSLLPFLFFCGAVYLLIRSLWIHIKQMGNIRESLRNPHLEAHFAVVKSMVLFLVSQVIIFVCMFFILVYIVHFHSPLRLWMFILRCAPPFLHSAHLIYHNPNIKTAFIKTCQGLGRCI